MIFISVIILIAVLYLLAISGRKNHAGIQSLRGWSYAHRGLHDVDKPENSMAAFKAALEGGYGIELDVHLLKDGNLAVIHDSLLKRTTGKDGRVEDLTTEDLKNYHLEGTDQTIPTLQEVLSLYAGKAPLIVEMKPVNGNHARLMKTACDMLDFYDGVYCMESFDPRCVRWLKKNRPEIIRGQLSENYLKTNLKLPFILRFILKHNLLHFWVSPDFVAYRYEYRKDTISNWLCRKLWKLAGVSWTLKTREEYDTAVKEGWIPIFEGFRP